MAFNVSLGVPFIALGCMCQSDTLNAIDFIMEVKMSTCKFYEAIPEGVNYAGIRSECETFIHNILKYKYLFELCDNRPY